MLRRIFVTSDECDRRGETAVRDRNPRVRRCGDPGGYSRNDLEWDRRVVHRLCFLAAASEHKGVATLQAHHTLSFAGELHEEGVDVFLGRRFFRPASFTDVEELGPSSCSRAGRKEYSVGERVVHHSVGRLDQLLPSHRDESGITGARADEKNLSFRQPAPAPAAVPVP